MHISTVGTFRFDDIAPTTCMFCEHKTAYFGYVGIDCTTCGARYDDEFIGYCLSIIRLEMKLTRKQLGELMGYAPSTVKKAELCRVSKPYMAKFKAIVKAHYCVEDD